MKKILVLLVILTTSSLLCQAQEKLWGVVSGGGGPLGRGAVFNTDPDGSGYQTKHAFRKYAGENPSHSRLALDNDGNLVGITRTSVFTYNPTTGEYIGREPFGESGTQARNARGGAGIFSGVIYGSTLLGGNSQKGTLFRYNFQFNEFITVHSFDVTNGHFPTGTMVATGGFLYGTTERGGISGDGVLYRYDTPSRDFEFGVYTKLVDFKEDSLGKTPVGDLLTDNGKLIGVTASGGQSRTEGETGNGTVFMYDLANDTLITILDTLEASVTGINPGGGLIKASDGNYYGVMENGGSASRGLIYRLDPVTFEQTIVYSFNEPLAAGELFFQRSPTGSLLEGSDGKLYGMASGGAGNRGIVYSYDPGTDIYTVEIELDDLGAFHSSSNKNSLIQAPNGLIYGITTNGGAKEDGVLFSLDPATGESTVEIDFGIDDGNDPEGGLLRASDGKLYGVAIRGGNEDEGTLFSYDPEADEFTVLHEFGVGGDGKFPNGKLTEGTDGIIYGTTQEYFSTGQGTVFSYNPETGEYLQRVRMGQFTEYDDLFEPFGGLVEYSPGIFYGTTSLASAIYSYNAMTDELTTEKVLVKTTEGGNIQGTLLLANDNKFYGIATDGGTNNDGTLFSFDPETDIFTVLHHFDEATEGNLQKSSLIQASDGKLYGTTSQSNGGFIFSYDIANDIYTSVHSHADADLGTTLQGTLAEVESGKLLGMTRNGGVNRNGTVFEFDIATQDYAVITEFDNFDGRNPVNGEILFYQIPNTWNGAEWSMGSAPQTEDDVVFKGDFSISEDGFFRADNLTIMNGVSLTIDDDRGITVNGDLTNNGNLTIASGASLITFADNEYSGNGLTINRSTTHSGAKYNFVGTSVQQSADITGADLGPVVYQYDESIPYADNDGLNRWLEASAEELVPGVGYAQANKGQLSFTGIPNTGTITVNGTYTEDAQDDNEGWNLVANPYTAPIRIDEFISENDNILGSLYIWDDNNDPGTRGSNADYMIVNSVGIVRNSEAMTSVEFNAFISTSQGFFVKLLDNTDTDITFTEDMRQIGELNNTQFFRETPAENYRLNLSDRSGLIRQTLLAVTEGSTPDRLNRLYDAPMMDQGKPEALYSVKNETALSIQGLHPAWTASELGVNIATAGEYEIALIDEGNKHSVYLQDMLTGKITDLSVSSYRFYSEKGQFTSRFRLTKDPAKVLEVQDWKNRIYVYDNILHIRRSQEAASAITLYSLSGRPVMQIDVRGSAEASLQHLTPGVYLISDGVRTKKILIH